MKKALLVLLGLPVALVLLLALGLAVMVQQQQVSKSDLAFLVDVGQREGLSLVGSQQMIRQSLGRLATDAGQTPQVLDQVADRLRELHNAASGR